MTPRTPLLSLSRAFRLIATVALLAMVVAACGRSGDDETSDLNPVVENAPPSPTAGVAPPERAEEATLTIEGGKFDADTLSVQQDEPTVIQVDNRDDQAYRIRLGDVVVMEEVLASAVTDIAFTAPNPVQVEGELLAADSDTVLDTIQFTVQAPSGSSP